MSDVYLLMFGCAVTFIGVSGAYVYMREAFLAAASPPRESKARKADVVERNISEVA